MDGMTDIVETVYRRTSNQIWHDVEKALCLTREEWLLLRSFIHSRRMIRIMLEMGCEAKWSALLQRLVESGYLNVRPYVLKHGDPVVVFLTAGTIQTVTNILNRKLS